MEKEKRERPNLSVHQCVALAWAKPSEPNRWAVSQSLNIFSLDLLDRSFTPIARRRRCVPDLLAGATANSRMAHAQIWDSFPIHWCLSAALAPMKGKRKVVCHVAASE